MKQTFLSKGLPNKPKPFPVLFWMGSKTKLLPILDPFLSEAEGLNYYEPFVGGGSVFCYQFRKERLKKGIVLNDKNIYLISFYRYLKEQPYTFIQEIFKYDNKNNKEDYLKLRERFNKLKDNIHSNLELREMVGLFYYLNKTCFRGVFDLDKKNNFRVGFAYRPKAKIVDIKGFVHLSGALQKARLINADFEHILPIEDSFVYLDPPYHLLHDNYTYGGFSEEDHKRLREYTRMLDKEGCKVVMSNSLTDFISELYDDWFIYSFENKYNVNKKTVKECVISNFEPTKSLNKMEKYNFSR